ncbi:DUF5591 domain-containing protein [Methanolapillus ohkumae]|uniref:DUF5591 domain-containing protein n=1 Tax=Methanolapillus ohkumae TaxID=3028298 RepID=A0AA96VJH3_9EURY|nr:hypothetical protein MsAm2_13590 [Methanosarcinaceae archaeon Am2]
MSRIIPEEERSAEPLDTENIIYHPDMIRANEWIVTEYEIPVRKICIFVPCSKKKPYHESPSHRQFDKVIFSMLEQDDVHIVTFGTCGVTPRELDTEYPFMNYSFMMGKCNVTKIKSDFLKIETKRLSEYLLRTKDNYEYRIAYCIGDFREAMTRATQETGIDVKIVPDEETIQKNIQPNKKFVFSSLSCPDYLKDFRNAIRKGIKKTGLPQKEKMKIDSEGDTNDTEWYEF